MLPDILLSMVFSLLGLSNLTGFVRLFRLVRVARVLLLFKKNITLFSMFIKETYLDKIFTGVLIAIVCASIVFWLIEDISLMDSIWYVLVTFSTVGYGDIVPKTLTGRTIGIIIISLGIMLFSILTAAISSLYIKRSEKVYKKEINQRLDSIEEKLDKLSEKIDK